MSFYLVGVLDDIGIVQKFYWGGDINKFTVALLFDFEFSGGDMEVHAVFALEQF